MIRFWLTFASVRSRLGGHTPSTVWIMLPGGGIRVYYSAYELAPYAAGDFILTLMPEGNPGLFKAR